MVVNKTHKKIVILTFNQADLVYSSEDQEHSRSCILGCVMLSCVVHVEYQNMYIIDPAESLQVEAITNPVGLKVCVGTVAVYDTCELLIYCGIRWQ
jgi:hypothetical protein